MLPGVVLVLIGVVLLLGTLGVLPGNYWAALWQLWPLILVAVGANILLSRLNPWLGSGAAGAIVLGAVVAAGVIAATDTGPVRGFFGFGFSFPRGESGSGISVSVDRDLDPFQEVRLNGSLNVLVRVGKPRSGRGTTDDNLVRYIATEVNGQTLTIDTLRGIDPRTRTLVEIDLPSLRGASLHGSGTVEITDVAAESLELDISGSGDISATGTAEHLRVNISGSGDVSARDLRAGTVDVTVFGSGDASVFADTSLDVRIFGSGDVTYRGDPDELQIDEQGSGRVRRR